MADLSKEKKLALARRMLKEYQKKEKDHPNKPKIPVRKSESPKPEGEIASKVEHAESESLHGQEDLPNVREASPITNSAPDGIQTNYDTQLFEIPQMSNLFSSTNSVDYNNAASFFDNMQQQYIFEAVGQKTNELENVSYVGELSPHVNGAENHVVYDQPLDNASPVSSFNGTSPAEEVEENTKKLGPLSSSESLRQISMEVNDLLQSSIQESSDNSVGGTAISELEHRNQELVALLADEKQQTQQLQFQLQESKRREKELQDTIERVQAEVDARVVREVDPLQEQVRLYAETVGILVGEKTELQSALNRSQQLAKSKAAEVEELQGRLRTSKHRITDLERDYASMTAARELHEQTMQEVTNELNKLKLEHTVSKRELEELKEEKLELEQKVNLKTCEVAKLQKELQERISQLSLSQLTIQQLSSSDQPIVGEQVQALQQMNASLQRQLEQAVQTASSERDEFQLYVQQLNAQMASVTSQLEAVSDERDLLRQREDSATRHISELEKQLSDGPKLVAEDFHRLETQLKALKSANDDLSSKYGAQTTELKNAHSEIEKLTALLQEAQELKSEIIEEEQLDRNALMAAMESDKLAAARAVSQNQTLKQQVTNLEDTMIALNNEKSLLKTDYEKALVRCKNLEEELAKSRETARDILNEHNQQLMNLAHNNEIETLKLSLEQLQKELQDSKSHIDTLKAENSELQSQRTPQSANAATNIDIEAMEKLQEKFTKTMAEVAELSEEKLRLEHLVLQLQDETETIGEYVSLYQTQRRLLRQRAEEKDKQLACLSKDREELKIKLNQLNKLIVKLIEDKGQDSIPIITNGEDKTVESTPEPINGPTDTAGEIMDLITSIGSSSLVDSENFHPCPWCSGRLITV